MRIHRLSASFLLCNAIVFCCLLLGAAWGDAIAGPAYRRVLTSDASQTAWQDGLDITLAVDAERCKKAYGANWSRECAAPAPGKIGQVAKGVVMTPAVEGVWRWSGGAQIHFEPKEHLAPDTAYTISLDKLPLPPRFSLSAKNFVYRTQPQAVRVKGKENLWIDPSNKGRHILSVPLQFIWPADKRSAESALRVAAADPRSGLAFGEPAFVWNEACDEVVFNVPVQALPERTSAAILSFSGMPAWHFADGKRVVDASGGSRGAIYKTDFRVAITGKESIMDVKEISISPAYTDELAREYQLVVKTSMQTLPGEVLKFLDLVMLPAKREKSDRVDCDWPSMPAIGASDIARGQKIQARLLQPADEAATEIRMSVPVEAGRGLMAAMRSGLRATAGYSLGKVRRFILRVPSLEPEINFLQPGNILPLGSEQKIDIHSIGVKSIKWRIERIRDPFLALLAQKSGFSRDEECDFSTMGVAEEGSIDVVQGDPGKAAYTALDLSAANGGKGPFHGLMNLTLTGSNGKEQLCQVSRLILVTDLGLMLKTSVDGARTAFVRSLSTGNPVDGAEVRLLGANGLPVISGRTANGGRVDLPPVHGLKREKHPEAVVAVSGDDMAWLSLSESSRQVDYGDFAVSGRHGTSEGLTASVFSQRGLYMPGETLHFACVLRRLDWEPIANAVPLEAVMYGPAGNVVMKRKLSVGKDGLVSLDWKSDEDCATGTYRLDIRLEGETDGGSVVGSATARVEEFQPDTLALKAELSEMTDGWIRTAPGDKVSLKVRLDNLYGEPAVGHRIRVAFRAVPTQLSFPSRHTDLAFVDASPMNGDVQEIAIPDAVTDEKGEAVISLPVEKLRAGTNLGTLSIEGFEKAGGRAVSRSLSAFFSPRSVLLGYKPVDGANNLDYIPQASKAGVRIFLFDEKLKPVTDKDISLVLSARRYVTNLVSDAAGNYRYDATPVDTEIASQKLRAAAEGVVWQMPTDTAGDYLVTVRDAAGHTLASIPYGVAGNRLAEPSEKAVLANGALRLKLERTSYEAGDTIRFRMSAPFDGTGLVTIERENVAAHAWFSAKAGESVQEIRIPDDFEGRGYVNVSFVRSADSQVVYMNPHVFAVAPFTAGISRRDMGLSVKAPEIVSPGKKITVHVASRLPGRVQVFAVDEGVLALTDFATPDPLKDLLTDRALDVATRQAFDLLMPEHERLRGRIPGFGGGMGNGGGRFLNPFRRKSEPPFAFWSEIVDVSKDGRDVEIAVPDYFSGAVRIMAVGSAAPDGAPSACGSARASARVRGMLILKPQLPLAVAPGDSFEGAVVVANTVVGSGKNARVSVHVECPEGLSFESGKQDWDVTIDENAEKALVFRMRAGVSLGAVGVKFSARLNGNGDPVVRMQEVSVRPAAQIRRTERAMPLETATRQGSDYAFVSDRDVYPYAAQSRLSLSAAPLLALRSLLDKLDEYPYGCTEQSISRAMPYVVLWDLPELRDLVMKNGRRDIAEQRKRGDAAVSRAISAIRASFDEYNGVTFWPGSGDGSLFLTAYASDLLVTMREHGMQTPEGLTENLLACLQRMVARTPESVEDGRIKMYGAWILQRDGRIMTNELNAIENYFKENTRNWENDVLTALLADSLATLRLSRRAEARLSTSAVQVTKDPFFSTTMARALYALIVQKSFPDKSDRMPLRELLDAAFSTDATTVDMAMASRALAAVASAKSPEPAGLDISCDEYAKAFGTPAGQPAESDGLLYLDAPGCRRYLVREKNGAAKELYAHLSEEGYDMATPKAESNGMEISRTYRNDAGESVKALALGDVVTARVCARSTGGDLDNAVLVDLVPGGLEPVLEKDAPSSSAPGLVRQERREDRAIFFVSLTPEERCFTYKLRAATRGRFTAPAPHGEAMYDPARNAVGTSGMLEIR